MWTLRGSRDAYRKAAAIGADGVITDFPDLGVNVRSRQRAGDRPTGLTSRVENSSAIASWNAVAGSWYAVTFDFGDPLEAPALWVEGGSASPDGRREERGHHSGPLRRRAARRRFVHSRHGGARMNYNGAHEDPSTQRHSRGLQRRQDEDHRRDGRQKGAKWVPLRSGAGWLRGRGEDVGDLRRKFPRGQGRWVPDRQSPGGHPRRLRAGTLLDGGVTAAPKLKPSSSEWVDSKEGPPRRQAAGPLTEPAQPGRQVRVG